MSELNYIAKLRAAGEGAQPPAQVAICIPSGRTWEADTAIRMIAVVARAVANGIPTITINEKNSVVSFSRNSMAENALAMGGDTYHVGR